MYAVLMLFSRIFLANFVWGQLSDPREKLSITATVDGSTNTDYRWESEDGDVLETGRVRRRVGASARHLHFRIYCGIAITLLYIYILL